MMSSRPKYYIGLAASLHDPAIAILDSRGTPLFVEASERYLQNKRAYHAPADDLVRVPHLVGELCDPDGDLIVAVSWSDHMLRSLELASATVFNAGAPNHMSTDDFAWPMPEPTLMLTGFRNSLSQAGLNLKGSRRIANEVSIRRYDHHLAHAATAAFTSPFDDCAVAIVDGYGEGRSTGFFCRRGIELEPIPGQRDDSPAELSQFVSLGHFYARLCALCGFDPIVGEEWKVMGLASYGSVDAELYELMRPLVRISGLGLAAGTVAAEARARLRALRARGRRQAMPAEAVADLAATGQRVFEDLMMELLGELHRLAPHDDLALGGGCALNSSCNGHILERTPFRRLHIPSAPADDGCALGAACLAFAEDHPGATLPADLASAFLGSSLENDTLNHFRKFSGFTNILRTQTGLVEEVVDLLLQGGIVGWIQGRAEFGPRALGHRSILADPRLYDMKERLNARVKFREEFRPFAPAILDEHGDDYFEQYQTSRYMERTLRFRSNKAALVPAVVHVDGTGRLQSVRREWTPLFYDLIQCFYRRTGVPLLLNTSLNVMGKPIVHTLEDALGLFFTSGLDALVVCDLLIRKDGTT